MIDQEVKEKLIAELEKHGNVGLACKAIAVSRRSYHRWRIEDSEFKAKTTDAIYFGKLNLIDVGTGGLLKKVKEGSFPAIKLLLEKMDPQFGGKIVGALPDIPAEVSSTGESVPEPKTITDYLRGLIKRREEKKRLEQEQKIKDESINPANPNGSEIPP